LDPEIFKKELHEISSKTAELQVTVDKNSENSKVRKTILKFISIFHPDKQSREDLDFFLVAEEITKQFNYHLKFY
jgi:hypothetical protein